LGFEIRNPRLKPARGPVLGEEQDCGILSLKGPQSTGLFGFYLDGKAAMCKGLQPAGAHPEVANSITKPLGRTIPPAGRSEKHASCAGLPTDKWRKRVGVEPTGDGVDPPPAGFEDRDDHRTACASNRPPPTSAAARCADKAWATSSLPDTSVALRRSIPRAG
jgi:hypothetical protein